MSNDNTSFPFVDGGNDNRQPKNGYDLPLLGLIDGSFYHIHITALVCITTSFVCAVTVIILAFRHWGHQPFFLKWSKGQRFVVYMAICDGLFNITHFCDHLQISLTRSMVHPKELCVFYAVFLITFSSAQMLMVNVMAVNAFMLLYYDRNLHYGTYDWKLLLWTFGIPFVSALTAAIVDQLGPNGV